MQNLIKFDKKNNNVFYERTPRMMSNSKIAIVGCGGSGSNIALALIKAGLRTLCLFDDDIVEASNLNRTDYRIKDIGQLKVKALSEMIVERRTDCQIYAYPIKASEVHNNIFGSCNLLIDCTDSYDFKIIMEKLNSCNYLKVGYDGSMYDIDGSREYIFDIPENQGYRVISTTVVTTLMLASKVVQIAHLICCGNIYSEDIRVLGDVDRETGRIGSEIKTNTRPETIKQNKRVAVEEDSDFEFEIYHVDRNAEEPTEEVIQQQDGAVENNDFEVVNDDEVALTHL